MRCEKCIHKRVCYYKEHENYDEDEDCVFFEEKKKGKWVENDYNSTICNKCGGIRRDNRIDHIDFCNKCGADMREEST